MNHYRNRWFFVLLPALLSCAVTPPDILNGCEEVAPTLELTQPEAVPGGPYDSEVVTHGKYLVGLLRCGSCHTHGALIGEPDHERLLAGSRVGIAYSDPLDNKYPGVDFPPNLTPDPKTGLGKWSEQEIVNMIRTGADRHGRKVLSVMPYPAFAGISDEDAKAIAAYLSRLPPVHHRVPSNVAKGQNTTETYVHFGVYRSKK